MSQNVGVDDVKKLTQDIRNKIEECNETLDDTQIFMTKLKQLHQLFSQLEGSFVQLKSTNNE